MACWKERYEGTNCRTAFLQNTLLTVNGMIVFSSTLWHDVGLAESGGWWSGFKLKIFRCPVVKETLPTPKRLWDWAEVTGIVEHHVQYLACHSVNLKASGCLVHVVHAVHDIPPGNPQSLCSLQLPNPMTCHCQEAALQEATISHNKLLQLCAQMTVMLVTPR